MQFSIHDLEATLIIHKRLESTFASETDTTNTPTTPLQLTQCLDISPQLPKQILAGLAVNIIQEWLLLDELWNLCLNMWIRPTLILPLEHVIE
jgi:hypothetical protein